MADHRYIHCLEKDTYYDSAEEASVDLGININRLWFILKSKSSRSIAGLHFKYERKPKENKNTKKK